MRREELFGLQLVDDEVGLGVGDDLALLLLGEVRVEVDEGGAGLEDGEDPFEDGVAAAEVQDDLAFTADAPASETCTL